MVQVATDNFLINEYVCMGVIQTVRKMSKLEQKRCILCIAQLVCEAMLKLC